MLPIAAAVPCLSGGSASSKLPKERSHESLITLLKHVRPYSIACAALVCIDVLVLRLVVSIFSTANLKVLNDYVNLSKLHPTRHQKMLGNVAKLHKFVDHGTAAAHPIIGIRQNGS